ncbi:hypothetical protein QOZ92_001897 [Paeniclostridium ghonii]|uniref:Uncharacterized protein n=1 Tax=Paraclostridium ghonii TaxID=29358 RepID=A0ABU0N0Z4_9FIRM|nr:hypothetical protein [Paeniclostridium ghonii]
MKMYEPFINQAMNIGTNTVESSFIAYIQFI